MKFARRRKVTVTRDVRRLESRSGSIVACADAVRAAQPRHIGALLVKDAQRS